MSAKWIICNLGNLGQIDQLAYAVRECGRECEVLTLGEINDLVEMPSTNPECVITSGSIWMNKGLRKARPNSVGNYHDAKTFNCSSYYHNWGKYLTQKKYMLLPFSEIIRQVDWIYDTLAVDGSVFIRPDSGEKEFAGELVHRDRFQAFSEDALMRIGYQDGLTSGLLCVVSSPVDIDKEFRLVIVDKKVVTGSTYRVAKHLHSEDISEYDEIGINAFAHKVLNDNPPQLPPFHVLDIAQESNGEFSIMEVGCFCCCGLYECDRRKIALSISECAEREFDSAMRSVLAHWQRI